MVIACFGMSIACSLKQPVAPKNFGLVPFRTIFSNYPSPIYVGCCCFFFFFRQENMLTNYSLPTRGIGAVVDVFNCNTRICRAAQAK
eukprot:NODE_4458_length_347_cov_72.637584_g3855_i0.p1 GENE.NODE_4458_length_347_cov_72.637584_g3855_i0~~NODE_4458_length_347_cov_72.637584_g3855_i0.p1  ORF type:complete len:87 (+),score=2.04 NODE_4458_length_347_cov_72.637584_g3855_i0:60-320(+)